MEKRATFSNKLLPYLLVAPQLVITLVFFYLPATQAVKESFFIQDAFGTTSNFVGFENYRTLFAEPDYFHAMGTTAVFAICRDRSPRCRSRCCSRCRPTAASAARPSTRRC